MSVMSSNIVFYLVNTAVAILVSLVVLRFLLQLTQANYYNPICQGVGKITAPLVAPLRALPTIGPVNLGVYASAVVIQAAGAALGFTLMGGLPGALPLLVWSFLSVFGVLLDLIFYALLGMIILSWLAPNATHPGAELVIQITEPLLAPFRRLIPNMGGLDLSPILLFVLVNLLEAMVVNSAARSFGLSSTAAQLFIGIG
ncbi:MAG: YggT family protein [Litorivicinaceae bacterium]|nr:YggT family protein [Litorivicinaceae bacterium]MDP5364205.1 YggT family protein [Litorivicinaceae bacterium]